MVKDAFCVFRMAVTEFPSTMKALIESTGLVMHEVCTRNLTHTLQSYEINELMSELINQLKN